MSKKKEKEKKNGTGKQKEDRVLSEVLGILIFTFAVLSGVAFFIGPEVSTLNALKLLYMACFGWTSVMIPVLLALVGVWVIWRKPVLPLMMLRVFIAGLLIGAWLNWAIMIGTDNRVPVAETYMKGGGAVSACFVSAAVNAVSLTGVFFILLALVLIYGKFALKISYTKLGHRLKPYLLAATDALLKAAKYLSGLIAVAAGKIVEKRRAKISAAEENKKREAEARAKKLMEEEAARVSQSNSFFDEEPDVERPKDKPLKPDRDEKPVSDDRADSIRKDKKEDKSKIGGGPPDKSDDGGEDTVKIKKKKTDSATFTLDGEEQTVTYRLPEPDEWLDANPETSEAAMDNTMRDKLEATLRNFQVPARIVNVVKGASFTRFEIELEPGTKVSRIVTLETDIALSLATDSNTIRIEAPIPGKSAVGIEVPNKERAIVPIRRMFLDGDFRSARKPLSFVLGEDIGGKPVFTNLVKMPHLLVAGSTNSGKSVCINCIICSILAREFPTEARFIMVDMKRVELTPYEGIPHLLTPVIKEAAVAASALRWVCEEMDRRYKLFAEAGVRDIAGYNKYVQDPYEKMFRLVVVIDELADLMMVSSPNMNVENHICRITQLARATGIHVILATQRPDTKVITGTIKNNIPSRISFAVASQIDSRTVLDRKGAESLLGCGDMLYQPIDSNRMMRLQGAFVSDEEVKRLVAFWRQQAPPIDDKLKFSFSGGGGGADASGDSFTSEDEALYKQAVEIVVTTGQCSISMLQRRLRIGYNRAARLVDIMEERHVVGPYDGSRPREVLITPEDLDTI